MAIDPRTVRTALVWLVIVCAVAISALAAVLETGVLTPSIIGWMNERLAREGDLQLESASLYLRPWSGLTLRDAKLTIPAANADSVAGPRPTVLYVGELDVGYRFTGLLHGTPTIRRVKLVRPDLDLALVGAWLERRAARGDGGAGNGGEGAHAGGRGLRIDDLRILEGRLRGPDGSMLDGLRLVGRIERRGGAWRIVVEDAGGRLVAERIDEELQLTGALDLDGDAIELEGLHLEAAGGRISFAGRVDPDGSSPTSLRVSGFALSLARVGSWFGLSHPLLDADLGFRLLATGRPDSLALRGGFRGVAADGFERDFHFAGVRRGDVLDLDFLRIVAGDARMTVLGRVALSDPPAVDATVIFRQVDLAAVLGDPDFAAVTDLDGTARIEGTGLSRRTFAGAADVAIDRATLFGLPVDEVTLHPRMSDGELQLAAATVRRGRSVVTGVGSLDADNRVAVELEGTIADLADLGAAFGGAAAALEGQATAEVRLLGPIARPSLEATLRFDDAAVLGTRSRQLRMDVAAELAGADTELHFEATGRGIGWGAREIPRATAQGTLRAGALALESLRLESDRSGALQIGGDLVAAGDSLSGRIVRLEIVPPDDGPVWSNEGPVRVVRRGGYFEITGLDLRGAGRVRADVTVDPDREVLVHAHGQRVDLAVFSPFLPGAEPVTGTLDFGAEAIVGPDTLFADLDVDLVDGSRGSLALDALRGRVTIRPRAAALTGLEVVTSVAKATVEGELALSRGTFREVLADSAARAAVLERVECRGLAVRVESPDWSWFWDLVSWPDLGGHGLATLAIEGPAGAPTVDLWAHVADGHFSTEPLDELVGRGRYESDRITITEGWVRTGAGRLDVGGGLPVTWSLRAPRPELVPGDPYDLRLDGKAIPVRAVAAFVPLLEMATGTADARLRLAGVPDSAHFEGDFAVTGATITVPGFADPLVDGQVAGTFDDRGLSIAGARFADGRGGRVAGSGTVTMRNLSATDWHLDVDAREYHYRGTINGVRATGSGTLVIDTVPPAERVGVLEPAGPAGVPAGIAADTGPIPRFTGSFAVEQAAMDERVLLPPASAQAIPEMPAGVQAPEPGPDELAAAEAARAAPGEEPPPLLARIELTADNNVWLRTPEIQAEMAGDVTLHANPRWVGLTGEMRTLQGTYVVLNTEFDIDRAEIRFVDPSDVGASNVDAEASTRVLDEDVTADVTGTLAVPVIRLSTATGMTEREIYELLALRRRPADTADGLQETGVVSGELVSSWTTVLANRFGREIGREIGLDTFDVERDDVATSLGLGKSLGSSFFLRYRQQVASDPTITDEDTIRERLETPERQLLLEYRLSEIFQLQGETGTIQGDGYLNVDLKAEWGY